MREEGGNRFPRGSIRSILHSRYVPFFAHILSPSRVHFPPFVLNPRTAEAQRGAVSPFQRQLSSFCRHLDGENVTHRPKCKDSMITALAWVVWACLGSLVTLSDSGPVRCPQSTHIWSFVSHPDPAVIHVSLIRIRGCPPFRDRSCSCSSGVLRRVRCDMSLF